jgi:hypothetical protein
VSFLVGNGYATLLLAERSGDFLNSSLGVCADSIVMNDARMIVVNSLNMRAKVHKKMNTINFFFEKRVVLSAKIPTFARHGKKNSLAR